MFGSILIVDDSETARMIIRKCFLMIGYDDTQFHDAEDGIKALTILSDFSIDLVVTDLNMPRMDGLTLIKKLRKNEKTKAIPILVLSSMGNDHLEGELIDLDVRNIIRKPLTPQKIQKALTEGVV